MAEGKIAHLRTLLKQVKFEAPPSILAEFIKHVHEDGNYKFFRYVQELVRKRELDALLLKYDDIWEGARWLYAELYPWLNDRQLRAKSETAHARERRRAIRKALWKASKGAPEIDYKEEWITEYLQEHGLTWDDVAAGKHFSVQGIRDDVDAAFGLEMDTTHPPSKAIVKGPGLRPLGTEYKPRAGDEDDDDEDDDDDDEEPEELPPPGAVGLAKRVITQTRTHAETRDLMLSLTGWEAPGDSKRADTANMPGLRPGAMPLPLPEDEARKAAYNPNWLVDWLGRTGAGQPEDFQKYPYKGWYIASPRVTLTRIANFLSDEDIDRTLDWPRKFAEILEYVSYLCSKYDEAKDPWGYLLNEAILRLNTHTVWEEYNYGQTKPKLVFKTKLVFPSRLPLITQGKYEVKPVARTAANSFAVPRNLLHRLPKPVVDVMYETPCGVLKEVFLPEFKSDEEKYWSSARPTALDNERPARVWGDHAAEGAHRLGFNMAEIEDTTFHSLMHHGPLETYRALKGPCAFKYSETQVGPGDTSYNDQLRSFSKFRGATRAGLTFVLRALGSQTREIKALASPWRKLIVRTTAQRAALPNFGGPRAVPKKRKGMPINVWRPPKLDKPPTDRIDPMAYNTWHHLLLQSQGNWAKRKVPELEDSLKILGGADRRKHPPVPTKNFKGPFVAPTVNKVRFEQEQLYRRLDKICEGLRRAKQANPRPLVDKLIEMIKLGEDGELPEGVGLGTGLEIIPRDQRSRHSEPGTVDVLPMTPEDGDLDIAEYVTYNSSNRKMLKLVPNSWHPRKRIFADRVQALVFSLDYMNGLSDYNWSGSLETMERLVNQYTDKPVEQQKYTMEEVKDYLDDLAEHGRIRIVLEHGVQRYARPHMDLHPEDTLTWHVDRHTIAGGYRLEPRKVTYEQFVKMSPHHVSQNMQTTEPALRGIFWRIGMTAAGLREKFNSEPEPSEEEKRELRSTYGELVRNWESKVENQRDEKGQRQVMDYRDVIKGADSAHYMDEWDDEDRDREDNIIDASVADNIVFESEANGNMLWPARLTNWTGADGRARVMYRRDDLWSWARPDALRNRRYFSLDRWPLHLQTPETREKIQTKVPARACRQFVPPPPGGWGEDGSGKATAG